MQICMVDLKRQVGVYEGRDTAVEYRAKITSRAANTSIEPETYGGKDRDEGAPTCTMLDVASRGTGWYRISSTKSSPFVCLRLMLGRFDSISSPFLSCFGSSVGDEGRFPIEKDDEFVATDSADADCNPRGYRGRCGRFLTRAIQH